MKKTVPIAIAIFFAASCGLLWVKLPLLPGVMLLTGLSALWILFFISRKATGGEGILSLLLTLSSFFVFEIFLTSLPEEKLPEEARRAPILIPPDKGNAIYQKNGFRGKRPCINCGEDLIRIVTMGGSSTYGIPLYYSEDTYSAMFQRLLDERRVSERYEVLNGGIPGYGVMQIIDSLEQEILRFKPDIVTVCAWFNDSSEIPSWYGFGDKSDRESYQYIKVLSKIQKIPGFKSIYNSKSFAFVRYYLLRLITYMIPPTEETAPRKRKKKKSRMSPAEFEWGLEEIVKLSRKHDFLPVLIYEPVNRSPDYENATEGKAYYEIVKKVASKYGLPLADTLSAFNAKRDEWLFYDIIHPNKAGHEVIAETLYKTLFEGELSPATRSFLGAKGVNFSQPAGKKEYFLQFESEKLKGKQLNIKARAPFSDKKRDLRLTINSRTTMTFPRVADKNGSEFSYLFPVEELIPPIVNLSFEIPVSIRDRFKIGDTGAYSPVHIYAKSGGKDNGWTQNIDVNGISYTGDYDGYSVVAVNAVTGNVVSSRRFNLLDRSSDTESLYTHLSDLGKDHGFIVVITLKTDGFINTDQELLSKAFQLVGGSGRTPKEFESFLLIGVTGAYPGTAVELAGGKLLEQRIGDKRLESERLLDLEVSWR